MSVSVFGTRLRQARVLRGLSQKQLGIKAGLDEFVASPRVNRYELGIHEPDYATAQRLANVLNVSVAFLYADDDIMAELILVAGLSSETIRRETISFLKSAK